MVGEDIDDKGEVTDKSVESPVTRGGAPKKAGEKSWLSKAWGSNWTTVGIVAAAIVGVGALCNSFCGNGGEKPKDENTNTTITKPAANSTPQKRRTITITDDDEDTNTNTNKTNSNKPKASLDFPSDSNGAGKTEMAVGNTQLVKKADGSFQVVVNGPQEPGVG